MALREWKTMRKLGMSATRSNYVGQGLTVPPIPEGSAANVFDPANTILADFQQPKIIPDVGLSPFANPEERGVPAGMMYNPVERSIGNPGIAPNSQRMVANDLLGDIQTYTSQGMPVQNYMPPAATNAQVCPPGTERDLFTMRCVPSSGERTDFRNDIEDITRSDGGGGGGLLSGDCTLDWAKLSPTATYQALFQAKGNTKPGTWFGRLNAVINEARWAYSEDEGKTWYIPRGRRIPGLGNCIDQGGMDVKVTAAYLMPNGIERGPRKTGDGTGMTPTDNMGMMCDVPGLKGVEPRIIQQRKCPPKTVMAINGMCYLRDALPAQLRMNKRRKAPVSYQDAQYIKKGVRASKRIKEYSMKSEKEYRKFVPRKKSTTSKRKR